MAGRRSLGAGTGSWLTSDRADLTKWTVLAATAELIVRGLVLFVRPQLFV